MALACSGVAGRAAKNSVSFLSFSTPVKPIYASQLFGYDKMSTESNYQSHPSSQKYPPPMNIARISR